MCVCVRERERERVRERESGVDKIRMWERKNEKEWGRVRN